VILALLGVGVVRTAQAGSGLLGLDHPVTYDDAGIWKRGNQLLLIDSMLVGEVGLGLWEGGESRFGRTIWQSIDASAIGGAASEILKYAFSRERPSQTNDPNRWFKGHGAQSFPSGGGDRHQLDRDASRIRVPSGRSRRLRVGGAAHL
jgi:undecaprenyl-diphosphatase